MPTTWSFTQFIREKLTYQKLNSRFSGIKTILDTRYGIEDASSTNTPLKLIIRDVNGDCEVRNLTLSQLNGKAITDIFESDGVTVKKATSATSATSATNATHATSADSATNATNADTLDGQHGNYYISMYAVPSENVRLSAITERMAGSTYWTTVKQFQVKYTGRYRVSAEIKADVPHMVSMKLVANGKASDSIFTTTNTVYTYAALDIGVEAGGIIAIQIIAAEGYVYLRNAYCKFDVISKNSLPNDAVLQD